MKASEDKCAAAYVRQQAEMAQRIEANRQRMRDLLADTRLIPEQRAFWADYLEELDQ